MKAGKIPYHPDGDADDWQTVEGALDAIRGSRVSGPDPAASTNNGFALWDGTGGRTLKDAGYTQIPTAAIADDAVTYAKMQNISAQFRMLGRNSASAGNTEEVTFTQFLDWVGSAANGDMLYRTGGSWARLGKGTERQVLTMVSDVPVWSAPNVMVVAAGALSSQATLDVPLAANDMYEIDLINVVPATDNVGLWMRFSQSSSFLSGASDYGWGHQSAGTNFEDEADDAIELTGGLGNVSSEGVQAMTVRIFRPGVSSFTKSALWSYGGRDAASPTNAYGGNGAGKLLANTDAIDGVRFFFSSGDIASGYYAARYYRFT
jgi:hypothetical protein